MNPHPIITFVALRWSALSLCVFCIGCARDLPFSFNKPQSPLAPDAAQSSESLSNSSTSPAASQATSTNTPWNSAQLASTPAQTFPQPTAPAIPSDAPAGLIPANYLTNNPNNNGPTLYEMPAGLAVETPALATSQEPVPSPTIHVATTTSVDSSALSSAVAPAAAFSMPVPHSANDQPASPAPTAGQPRAVQITIHNVQPGRGTVRVAAFTNPANFPNAATKGMTAVLGPASSSLDIALPVNEAALELARQKAQSAVAVAVFQDINGDGQLNRNRQGIPTEPCAFSRGAMGRRGPPPFEQAAVPMDLNSGAVLAQVEITLPSPGAAESGRF